jgi:error-prone DNA polymerase
MGTIGSLSATASSAGMLARGYDADFAARCFAQIEGFGSYGFPKAMPPASRGWSISRPG